MTDSIKRQGFTLLELLIAIGLTSILMVSLFAAMDIYFKLQLDSHDDITRQQIARTLLRQMTRDIQSVVFVKKQTVDSDTSPVNTEASGETSSDGLNKSAAGPDGTAVAGLASSASSTSTAASMSSEDTTAAMLTYTSGLVGSATDLLLYISRPDRTLSYIDAQSLTSTGERTGDLMIVRYLIADTAASGLPATIAKRFAGTKTGPVGLVRITGDLYGMSTAVQTGEEENFTSVDKIDAEEVSHVAFSYYDGANWQETWDSGTQNSLPIAIEIILTLRTVNSSDEDSGDEADPYALGETTHRVIVALPLAEPFIGETAL
jgi:prepilin-type N-terminal cleavage/methylation domain-containing protein